MTKEEYLANIAKTTETLENTLELFKWLESLTDIKTMTPETRANVVIWAKEPDIAGKINDMTQLIDDLEIYF
jgi:hypothetical protein